MARSSLTALTILALLPTGEAAAGGYVSAHAGLNLLPEIDASLLDGTLELDYQRGAMFGGAVGYEFAPRGLLRFRVEGEVSRQRHDLDGASLDGVAPLGIELTADDATGDGRITSLMVNGYVDFDFQWPVTPFVGIGAGVAFISLDDIGGTVSGTPIPGLPPVAVEAQLIDDSDTVGAAQAMVGLAVDVAEAIVLAVAYRAFVTTEAEVDVVLPIVDETETFASEIFSQAVRAELRYRF